MHQHNIDGVEIPFDRSWKNIGIALSGGADSALLAYILCELPRGMILLYTLLIMCAAGRPNLGNR